MTTTTRKSIFDYLESMAYRRFKWGVHDCCTFARDIAEIVTGRKIELPNYRTMAEARDLIAANDGGIKEWVTDVLRVTPVDVESSSELGECCIVQLFRTCGGTLVISGEIADGPLGVWFDGWVYLPGRDGLVKTGMENIIAAWEIS